MDLPRHMKRVLASEYAFMIKLHFFHWNVTGPHFRDLHKFFEEQYEDIFESIDHTAEQIRTLKTFTPGSFQKFQELSVIDTITAIPTANKMLEILCDDHDLIVELMYEAFNAAEDVNNQAIMDHLAGRIDFHKKYRWMCESMLY